MIFLIKMIKLSEFGEVYECEINNKGRFRIPRSLRLSGFREAVEDGRLRVGPHIMDSGYKSVIALYNANSVGLKASEIPMRDIYFKMEGCEVVVPNIKKLLYINDNKIVVAGNNPYSVDFWNPIEWRNFYLGRKPMEISLEDYDYFLGTHLEEAA